MKYYQKCMSKDYVWKIISFFHTNRPKFFSRLFQAGKRPNFFHTIPAWKMIKLFPKPFQTPQEVRTCEKKVASKLLH